MLWDRWSRHSPTWADLCALDAHFRKCGPHGAYLNGHNIHREGKGMEYQVKNKGLTKEQMILAGFRVLKLNDLLQVPSLMY